MSSSLFGSVRIEMKASQDTRHSSLLIYDQPLGFLVDASKKKSLYWLRSSVLPQVAVARAMACNTKNKRKIRIEKCRGRRGRVAMAEFFRALLTTLCTIFRSYNTRKFF